MPAAQTAGAGATRRATAAARQAKRRSDRPSPRNGKRQSAIPAPQGFRQSKSLLLCRRARWRMVRAVCRSWTTASLCSRGWRWPPRGGSCRRASRFAPPRDRPVGNCSPACCCGSTSGPTIGPWRRACSASDRLRSSLGLVRVPATTLGGSLGIVSEPGPVGAVLAGRWGARGGEAAPGPRRSLSIRRGCGCPTRPGFVGRRGETEGSGRSAAREAEVSDGAVDRAAGPAGAAGPARAERRLRRSGPARRSGPHRPAVREAGGRRRVRQRGEPPLLPGGPRHRQPDPGQEAPLGAGRRDDAVPAGDGAAARRGRCRPRGAAGLSTSGGRRKR